METNVILESTKIVKNGDRITKASAVFKNENFDGVITDTDLPESIGPTLVRAINSLYHQIVDSNGVNGNFKLENMGNFYGNDMTITINRRNDGRNSNNQ